VHVGERPSEQRRQPTVSPSASCRLSYPLHSFPDYSVFHTYIPFLFRRYTYGYILYRKAVHTQLSGILKTRLYSMNHLHHLLSALCTALRAKEPGFRDNLDSFSVERLVRNALLHCMSFRVDQPSSTRLTTCSFVLLQQLVSICAPL
jgi:hypothetical protein